LVLGGPTLRASQVTVADTLAPSASAVTTINVTELTLRFSSRNGSLKRKRTVTMAGFPTGSTIYAHYRLRGRTRLTRALGAAQGPCGVLSATLRAIPLKHIALGKWTIQYDTSRSYSPHPTTFLSETVNVYTRLLR